jgi:hypothetical protein
MPHPLALLTAVPLLRHKKVCLFDEYTLSAMDSADFLFSLTCCSAHVYHKANMTDGKVVYATGHFMAYKFSKKEKIDGILQRVDGYEMKLDFDVHDVIRQKDPLVFAVLKSPYTAVIYHPALSSSQRNQDEFELVRNAYASLHGEDHDLRDSHSEARMKLIDSANKVIPMSAIEVNFDVAVSNAVFSPNEDSEIENRIQGRPVPFTGTPLKTPKRTYNNAFASIYFKVHVDGSVRPLAESTAKQKETNRDCDMFFEGGVSGMFL